jgi:hypothetical protein
MGFYARFRNFSFCHAVSMRQLSMARLLSPPKLIAQFECGLIDRSQLHAAMAQHAQVLIEEMLHEREFPEESRWEQWRNRLAANRLSAQHGEIRIRELLHALSDLDDFAPADLLWNVAHRHVPLHCFFRTKRAPIFRIKSMTSAAAQAQLVVEYSEGKSTTVVRETFQLARDRRWQWQVISREAYMPMG